MRDNFLRLLFFVFILSQMENSGMAIGPLRCPNLEIPNAKIRYRSRNRVARIRCNLRYVSVGGDRRLTCIRGAWNGRIPSCIAPGCKNLKIKNGEVLSLYNGALANFYCHHGYQLEGKSSSYCDGAHWDYTELPVCKVPLPNKDHMSCSFESEDLCEWKQDHLDTQDWTRLQAGFLALIGTASPTSDHTFGTPKGHYIVAESSLNWVPKDTARIFSPIIALPEETPACVTFWYYSYGKPAGAVLNVYVRPESEPIEIILPQLELNSSLANDWQMAYVYLEADDDFFQIVFEARGNDGKFQDVFVDDFLVASGEECIKLETEYETLRKNIQDKNNQTQASASQRPKESSWLMPLVVVAGIAVAVAVGFLIVWRQRRRKQNVLPDDSDIMKLKEDTRDEEEGDCDRQGPKERSTTSYRPLENTNYPQEIEGTPI